MSQLAIKESRVLKRDSYFQLQRVTTHDGESLLVKVGISDYGNEESLLEREFERFKALGATRSLTPIRLERTGGKLSAYYQDVDGVPLFTGAPLTAPDPSEFAGVVRGLCSVLAELHGKGVLLVGMSPRSFLRRSGDAQLVLTDAPFAQTVGDTEQRAGASWLGSPYLRYAAPEALVRSTHPLDHRADLYALGIVLHELICGRPPFESDDPAELIQCHLAKAPPSILEHDPTLSRGLSDLVLTLLAKDPTDRHEDVEDVEENLTRLLGPTSERRRTSQSSPPDSHRTPTPQFGNKPYGRDEPIRILRDKMQRSRTAAALVLIRGEAGIGKTSLLQRVQELEPQLVSCRGRFHQTGPVAPLSGWAGALRDLANAILTQSPSNVEEWRDRVLDALGDGAPLIGALVPEWHAILRSEAPANDALDAVLNRLALAIHRLFRCYAEADQPVVLILDDLQWADPSSLRILEFVLTLPDPVNLLILAGVRTSDDPPLRAALGSLEQNLATSAVEVVSLDLSTWGEEELKGYLAASFAGTFDDREEFVATVLARTDGNPFFVREFLKALVQQDAIRFDAATGTWRWSSKTMRTLPPVESIAGLLSAKLRDLPQDTKDALRVASCLGPTFTLVDLGAVVGLELAPVARSLEPAVAAGLLMAHDPGPVHYEFAHDRVLEACRAMASGDERAALCLRIGRTLHQRLSDATNEDRYYRLAGYFNGARTAIVASEEAYLSAELNLEAGKLAKRKGAFSQALDYLKAGLDFLGRESSGALEHHGGAWQERFELAVAVHEEAAEAALLNGELELMERLCDAVLEHVDTPLRKVFAYHVRIRGLNTAKNFAAGADCALDILRQLDVTFPRRPNTLHAIIGYVATKRRLFARPIPDLLKRPLIEDSRVKAASSLINSAYPAIYLGRPNLFPLFVLRQVNDALKHGHDDFSAIAYSAFALVLAAMGEFDQATELSETALRLSKQLQTDRLNAQLFMCHYTFVFPWQHHIKDVLPHYVEGVQSGLEHGDFEYSCFLMTLHTLARLHTSAPLGELQQESDHHLAKITTLGQERSIILQALLSQVLFDLRNASTKPSLSGPIYDERATLPRCMDPVDHNLIIHNHLAKLMLAVLLGDRAAALEAARLGRAHLATGAFAHYMTALFLFYEALAHLSLPGATPTPATLRKIRRSQRQMRKWSASAPMNFLNKYHLIEAELCRLSARDSHATAHFEKAIELAQTHGYLHEAGIAQERAAAFYLDRGMERLGRHYLRESYLSYRRWGATAVTSRLEVEFSQDFALMLAGTEAALPTLSHFPQNLDYRTLLKSSQAISGEMLLPRLVERLLKTMLEHAGAQRGLLLLERRGNLSIVAESDVDRGTVNLPEEENVEESDRLCQSVVHYAARTEKPVVLVDATREGMFREDPYVLARSPKSVLCTPILYQGKLLGLAYLENNRMSHVFTEARLEIVSLLAGQAAISIANARFHALQLEAQQAKINPHFLFNALSSIAELAITNGPSAEDAILRLAKLYRYILESSGQDLVTLAQELEVVRTYLTLEQLRYGSQLVFSVTHEGDAERVRLPGLLIQPLVENSIRHGVSPTLKQGHVWVHAVAGDTSCTIVVQDDGDGTKKSNPGTGFGLRSVQERLALVYGQRYSFAVSQRGGYRIEIEIPLDLVS